MKKILALTMIMGLTALSGCKKYLDVNTNPNSPQVVAPYLYLPPMFAGMAEGVQFDARVVGKYIQNFSSTAADDAFERLGGITGVSDVGGDLWRTVYWRMGLNLSEMMKVAEEQKRWDIVGVGRAMRAWGWQMLTDQHEVTIISEAFDQSKTAFKYEQQQFAYKEVERLCLEALTYLNRTDDAVSATYLAKGDLMYKGSRDKWIKFVYGLLAINAAHLSNKPGSYDAQKVMDYVDKSFVGNEDDAMITFNGNLSADANFWGPVRTNMNTYRQSKFMVSLMDGTVFPAVDPRMSRMLSPSPDGQFRGVEPTLGYTAYATAQRPNNFYGVASVGNMPANTPGRYLFDDKAKFPLMTYVQLQLIKAEAALKKGVKGVALIAYKNAIESHIKFVNSRNAEISGTPAVPLTQISDTEKLNYMNAVVPTDPNNLTLSNVMLQKYIAQFGWGFIEQWTDLRRYHYLDLDPNTGKQVFTGFILPTGTRLDPTNQGNPVYRLRPRYASEYVWNVEEVKKVGGLNPDYHTYEMWVTKAQ